jgi:conjugal transfer pilin signal peptidase TrbI
VLFVPPRCGLRSNAHFGEEPRLFGKRVLGMPGTVYAARRQHLRRWRAACALAETDDPHAASRSALGPTGTIPEGCYFVGTAHKDGFDSRYAAIGWICRPRILGTGRAIL